jgi:DNA-binding MarR family transcriptional regulator
MRLGALAENSRVSQPTATNLVTTLDERGWVSRRPDPTDARASLIEVSDAGLAALMAWRDELTTALMPLFGDLNADEVATLRRAVEIVAARVDAVDKAGSVDKAATAGLSDDAEARS